MEAKLAFAAAPERVLPILRIRLQELLCSLRILLIISECTRRKIKIGDAILAAASALRAARELPGYLASEATLPRHPTADSNAEGVDRCSIWVAFLKYQVLPIVDGCTSILRERLPHVTNLARQAGESAAAALDIVGVQPDHSNWPSLTRSGRNAPVSLPAMPAREKVGSVVSSDLQRSLHDGIFGIELCAAEVCAAIPLRFPDIPDSLDFTLATQTYEEMRHARLLADALEAEGGVLGSLSVETRIWENNLRGHSLGECLLIQHFLGEGYALGHDLMAIDGYRRAGRTDLADIHISLHLDEVEHVRDGLAWYRKLSEPDPMHDFDKLEAEIAATPPPDPFFCEYLRSDVGYTADEIRRQRSLRDAR